MELGAGPDIVYKYSSPIVCTHPAKHSPCFRKKKKEKNSLSPLLCIYVIHQHGWGMGQSSNNNNKKKKGHLLIYAHFFFLSCDSGLIFVFISRSLSRYRLTHAGRRLMRSLASPSATKMGVSHHYHQHNKQEQERILSWLPRPAMALGVCKRVSMTAFKARSRTTLKVEASTTLSW